MAKTSLDRLGSEAGAATDQTSLLQEAIAVSGQSEPSLAERYAWIEAMINHVPDYIYAKDLEGRFLFANNAIVKNNGFERLEELVGLTEFDIHPVKAAEDIAEIERRVMETGEPHLGFEERRLRGEGWLMMSRVPLTDRTGKIIGVVGASRDITARKRAEELMKAQARLLQSVARGTDLQPFLNEVSALLETLIPRSRAAIVLHRKDGDSYIGAASPTLNEADATAILEAVELSWRVLPILSGDGEHYGLIAVSDAAGHDASLVEFMTGVAQAIGIAIDRHSDAERIAYMAEHDALTGLPNRALLDRKLNEMLAEAERLGTDIAIAFLDLDHFKLVNDSLGHAAGDELLKVVAQRIFHEVGRDGLVSRIGGDEFIVALRWQEGGFGPRLARIRQVVAQPLVLSGMHLQLTCSIGVSYSRKHGNTANDLFASADMALYRAKEGGRNDMRVFSSIMAEEASRKLMQLEELRRAIRNNEFVLHYQPQQDMRSGKIVGVEALVRWNHPARGLVPPGDFIPLAEESGLIVQIGEMVLREACRQVMDEKWQFPGAPALKISVNMSPRQFREPGMIDQVATILAETGLDSRRLEIEVTESLLMHDIQGAVTKMHELNALGVRLAIDDFGTGYSSLSALKSFPLSRLKIDRSFIAGLPLDSDDIAIASAIMSLAGTMGLEAVAEGVETEEQARFLSAAGCNIIQGYWISKPVPADQISRLLK
jgi:diguanylate cyclase (GGDEF)-like protein/PAS domain S-box-containing protein